MKYIKENDCFETSDIALASAIYCKGGRVEAIDKTSPTRAVFLFERTSDLDALVQGFWSHSLSVEPLAYFNSLKELKTRLYQ